MTTSVTGGGLVFSYNTFLQRGLNLLDVQDPATARFNLGVSAANLGLQPLTFGTGLLPGSFNSTSPATIAVNASTNGTASTIASYDSSGSLTTSSALNFGAGLASITRGVGTNGSLSMQNTGAGPVSLLNGQGLVQLVGGGGFSITSGTSGTITTSKGATVTCPSPLVEQGSALSVTLPPGSATGSQALTVTGGATIDAIELTGKLNWSSVYAGAIATGSVAALGKFPASTMYTDNENDFAGTSALATTGVFTCPIAGRYRCTLMFSCSPTPISIRKELGSTGTVDVSRTIEHATEGTYIGGSFSTVIKCVAGDKLYWIAGYATTLLSNYNHMQFELLL